MAGGLEIAVDPEYAKVAKDVLYNYLDDQKGIENYQLPKDVLQFIKKQLEWMTNQSSKYKEKVENRNGRLLDKDTNEDIGKETQFWLSVECTLLMVRGMWDAMNYLKTDLTIDQFLVLPYMADLEDILNKFSSTKHYDKEKKEMGDCTIIVKDQKDKEDDVFIAHNTHNDYAIIMRIFKSTKIEWNEYSQFMKAKTMRYSGRYGGIASKDDFYILDSGISAMETSILIYNSELYDLIHPESVPYFVSVTVANWMSGDNKEWAKNFLNHYGGTHVAQWVLIDTNKEKYSKDYISVLDAFMGKSEYFDVSKEFKKKGYWAGYNVPYSKAISEACNYDPINHGYTTEERARIIAEKIDGVKTPEEVRKLIRYNGNATHPCGSISPRCDLASGGRPFGAIDSKYTQASWIQNDELKVLGVVSPTFDSDKGFPPFEFKGKWKDVPHRSTAITQNFGWNDIYREVGLSQFISE